jgi:uncharacterized protein (DUF927 family)
VRRVADRFALVAAAGEMATAFGIVPWQPGAVIAAAKILLYEWIEERGGTGPAEATRAIEQVRKLIEQHGDSRFDRLDWEKFTGEDLNAQPPRPVPNRLGWTVGKAATREWLVPPEVWREEFCKGFDPTMVARVLSEKQMLDRGEGKHWAKHLRIAGMARQRLYVLIAKVLSSQDQAGPTAMTGANPDSEGGSTATEPRVTTRPGSNGSGEGDLRHADPKYDPPPRDIPF